MKRLVEILAVAMLAAVVFSGCSKEGSIVVQNNTNSTYSWELLNSDILGQTFPANESKGFTTTWVDRSYDFVATQKDGYFEHPYVVKDSKYLPKKGSVIFKIESRPAYIKYVNITSDNYQVDITCPANNTIKQISMPGRTLDSLEIEAGYSYNVKFTQLDGYVLYPSTKEYTVNADCSYIYTCETPNLIKGASEEIEEYEY